MTDHHEDGGCPSQPPAPTPGSPPATGDREDQATASGNPLPAPSPLAGTELGHLHCVTPVTVNVDFDIDELADLVMERIAKRLRRTERGRSW